MFAQTNAQTIKNFLILRRQFCLESLSRQNRNISYLVFFAFFFVLTGLGMFAEELAVGIEFVTPFFAVFADDSFIVRALFFPANYRSPFCFFVGSCLHRLRHIRTAEVCFLFFSASVGA